MIAVSVINKLCIGETISVIGDQISLIAFPWLILQMTNSAALTGLVFAVQGIPRAALMLAGGALVDRTSPRLVMLVSNGLRMLLVVYLAYMISQDTADITSVFLMAFAFGVADAFFIRPAPLFYQAWFLAMNFRRVTLFYKRHFI